MKMKSVFVSMLAVAALASCSKEDVMKGGGGSNVPAGVDTYATFNFNVEGSKPGVRGAHATEGNEGGIADVHLLVFDGVAADGELLISESVNHISQSATIATTSGPKRIFVIANDKNITALANITVGTKLSAFYAMMTDPSTGTLPNPDTDMGAGFATLLENAHMLMANVADVSSLKTLAPNITADASKGGADAQNHFTFNVKRSVAKGNLLVKPGTADLVTKDGLFTFGTTAGDITYAVRNVNRSVNYIQQFVGGHNVTSNDETDNHTQTGARPFAPYYNKFDATTPADLAKIATYAPYYFNGYDVTGQNAARAGITLGNDPEARTTNVYFTENSNNNQLRGNTSFFAIATKTSKVDKDKIAAAFTIDAATGKVTTTAAVNDYTTGNFWYIREIPTAANINFEAGSDRRVFVSEQLAWEAIYVVLTRAQIVDATTIQSATDLQAAYNNGTLGFDLHKYFGKYTDGISYYRLNIYETLANNARRHLVRRNHAYLATVTGFATLGDPTEGDLNKDPEKPVDAETTHVTATITIQLWHEMSMEDEL